MGRPHGRSFSLSSGALATRGTLAMAACRDYFVRMSLPARVILSRYSWPRCMMITSRADLKTALVSSRGTADSPAAIVWGGAAAAEEDRCLMSTVCPVLGL